MKTDDAAERVLGEYMAMLEIHSTSPNFAPQPRGYGKCDNENAHFFICDYLTISHDLPNPVRLGKKLAELHRNSNSPTGKFGFHVTTFDGKLPLNTAWDSNVSFLSLLLSFFAHQGLLGTKLHDIVDFILQEAHPRCV